MDRHILAKIRWKVKTFDELDTDQLYRILRLRAEVFIVEQKCYYQDLDDKDRNAWHLMAWDGTELVAYARLLPKGVSYDEAASIGRVVTHIGYRGIALGRELMNRAIDLCGEYWPGEDIKISAQSYLEKFYSELGFVQCGEGYLEDDIPHIPMLRKLSQ